MPLIDLLFIDDITDEDKEALETLKEEDFQKYKEKREAKFTGGEISKDYPVSNVIKNPSDKLIDNENISYNEKANNLNKTQIETKNVTLEILTSVSSNIENELKIVNKNLSRIENIKKFFVVKEKFSIENGMLTPTLKLKRYKIIQKYKKDTTTYKKIQKIQTKYKQNTKHTKHIQ